MATETKGQSTAESLRKTGPMASLDATIPAAWKEFSPSRETRQPNARPAAWNTGSTGSIPRYPVFEGRSGM